MYYLLAFCFLMYFPYVLVNKLTSKHTTNKIVLFKFTLYSATLSMLIGLILVLIEQADFAFDFVTLTTALLFGAMVAVCQLVTFYSLQVTSVAISNMSATASVIIPSFAGMLFFNEAITAGKILGIIAFLIAAYLIIAQNEKEKRPFTLKSLIACLIIFLTSGLGSITMQLFAKYSNGINDSLFLLYAYTFDAIIMLVCVVILSIKNKLQKKRSEHCFFKNASLALRH